jgi:hypothetical protein
VRGRGLSSVVVHRLSTGRLGKLNGMTRQPSQGKQRKRWEDLRPGQRQAIVVLGVGTGLLQAVMLWDLWRRPAEQVRGSKRVWVLASFVRPIGQAAYWAWGRLPGETRTQPWPETREEP